MNFGEYQARIAAGDIIHASDTAVPKEARPLQGHRAGLVVRTMAAFIDLGAVILTVVVINAGVSLVRLLLEQTSNITLPRIGLSVAAGTILMWLNWTWSWASTGRSIGCYVMGLRVVNHEGGRLRVAAAALRALFCIGFPIGLLWALVSNANRSVQDVVLRTSVIHDWVMGLPSLLTTRTQPKIQVPTPPLEQ